MELLGSFGLVADWSGKAVMDKFASLCILSYKRQEMLYECLESLHNTLDYPVEVIVNCDGEGLDYRTLPAQEMYSKLIVNRGYNRGVGRSFQNCLGVAEGDYIFKIDSDIIFKPHWLSTAINILDSNSDIGSLSLFNYNNYDPDDKRFTILEERPDCNIVSDFVSSLFAFRTEDAYRYDDGPLYGQRPVPDDGLHQSFNGKLAITKEDFVTNQGFGINSVYLTFDDKGTPSKRPTYDKPLLFNK